MPRVPLLLAIVLLVGACDAGHVLPVPEPTFQEGRYFVAEFATALRRADKIVVTEHSNYYDAVDPRTQLSLLPEPVVYESRELSRAQRARLEELAGALSPPDENKPSPCLFEPHHTLKLFKAGRSVGVLQINFRCDEVKWNGLDALAPPPMFAALEGFIASLGLQPNRDWEALAAEKVAAAKHAEGSGAN